MTLTSGHSETKGRSKSKKILDILKKSSKKCLGTVPRKFYIAFFLPCRFVWGWDIKSQSFQRHLC